MHMFLANHYSIIGIYNTWKFHHQKYHVVNIFI